MSYLIKNNEVIATTSETLRGGAEVQVAWHTADEQIDANREENLVNSFGATASNARKWDADKHYTDTVAVSINDSDDEFKLT